MCSRLFVVIAAFTIASLNGVEAALAVYDISPRLVNGKLYTYGFDDAGIGNVNPVFLTPNELRVFPYFFGDIGSSNTYSTSNPGTNALGTTSGYPASNLPPPSAPPSGTPKYVAFDVLGDLQYWTGDGFGPVPAGETLNFSIVGTGKSFVAGTGQGPYPQAAFTIQNIAADGSMHKHMTTVVTAGTNPTATDGIYLVEMREKIVQADQQTLYVDPNTGSPVAPSLPFFALFDCNANADVTSATYTAAQQWVQANLVPFGDYNRDGITTVADLQAMMTALSDLSKYKAENHLTDFDLTAFGDVNQDGVVNNADLQALLGYLASGGTGDTGLGSGSLSAVPEPNSVMLASLGAVGLCGMWRYRRSRSREIGITATIF